MAGNRPDAHTRRAAAESGIDCNARFNDLRLCRPLEPISVTYALPQPLCDDIKPVILALNNAHAAELSWLDVLQLELLLREGRSRRYQSRQ
jgi:hypothetical protein